MPDITMCLTATCPKKDQCYRYIAKPDRFQSYSDFTEFCKKTDEFFWETNYKMREENVREDK